jgi:SagB-type dehydrogenase family enzyme
MGVALTDGGQSVRRKSGGWTMRPKTAFLLVLAGLGALVGGCGGSEEEAADTPTPSPSSTAEGTSTVLLPDPRLKGEMTLEEAILKRRSRRDFKDSSLALEEISQILWAAQGITESGGFRAAPSAGALYPLDLYLVVGKQGVEGLGEGVYHYLPQSHSLELALQGDVRQTLARLSVQQMFIAEAPLSLLITGEYERTTGKYGERGVRYVHMEAGHVGQNVYLQVEALGLGTVTVGAFQDEEISQALKLPASYRPLYVMPIGHPES